MDSLLASSDLKPSADVRIKGAWSKEEDDLLRNCIEKYGVGKWSSVPKRAGRIPGRTANDIKNYWNSHLGKKLDAKTEKKKKKEAIVDARVMKHRPQRVSKLWTWPKDLQQDHDHQVMNPTEPKPTVTGEQQENGWFNELLNGDEIDTTDHSNMFSSLDFQFGYELEQVMDEGMFSGGVIEWEKLLQETSYSDD